MLKLVIVFTIFYLSTQAYVENVDMPESVYQCSDPYYKPNSAGVWNFSQIARAFFVYGVKPWNLPNPSDPNSHISDCVAALTIVSGECQPAVSGTGCSTGTGPSGVFQTDFLRTVPGFPTDPVMSLCSSSYAAGYMIAPYLAEPGKTSTLSYKNGAPASLFTCYNSKPYVNDYNCPDPNAVPGKLYTNFIGPFCHKAYASRWSNCVGCCGMWNGGANNYQPPFPDYFEKKALEQGSDKFEGICRAEAAFLTGVTTTSTAAGTTSTGTTSGTSSGTASTATTTTSTATSTSTTTSTSSGTGVTVVERVRTTQRH
jgi:hypothetical protein